MARYTGFNNRFNAGELAPEAWSDTDLAQHAHGCALGLNFVGRVAGPLARRPGFWCLGSPKLDVSPQRLIPFRRSIDDALMLEFGEYYFRVWTPSGDPLLNAGAPVEVATPFPWASLAGLRWRQIDDVIEFTSTDGLRPQTLRRASNTSWSWAATDYRNGPWRAENTDTTWFITPAGSVTAGASCTLGANKPTFQPGHVGALFRFRANAQGGAGVLSWAPGTAYNTGQPVVSDGKIYTKTGGADKSGNTPPVHDQGTASDGAIAWTYQHDGEGVVKVTAYSDAQNVSGTVFSTLPLTLGAGTTYWSEGAYSDYRGWPRAAPALREERLVVGGGASEPDKVDLTRTAGFTPDYLDFKPGLGTGRVVDDDAVRRRVGDESSRLVWLVSGAALMAGTTAAEYVIAGATVDDPIAPASTTVRTLSEYGSDLAAAPVKAHDGVLFVARGGSTLRNLRLAADSSFGTEDLTVLAAHIADRQFDELAWTAQPDNILWARLHDGGLAAFVYHVQQKVAGWTQQQLAGGWTVESLATLPGDRGRDVLWASAARTKNGAPQRAILLLADRKDGCFYDCAMRYEGAPATVISGLDALEGETVDAIVDGAQYRGLTVAAGAVTLPRAGQSVTVGLSYMSRFESLPLDLQGPGSTLGQRLRLTQGLVVLQGVEAYVGSDAGPLERVALRGVSETASLAAKRFHQKVTFGGGVDRDRRVVVQTDCGFDLEIHALKPSAEANA